MVSPSRTFPEGTLSRDAPSVEGRPRSAAPTATSTAETSHIEIVPMEGRAWSATEVQLLVHTIDAEIQGFISTTSRWYSLDRLLAWSGAWFVFWLASYVALSEEVRPSRLFGPTLGSCLAFGIVVLHDLFSTRQTRRERLARLQRVVRLASGVLDTARSTFDPHPELRLLLELAVERGLEALQRAGALTVVSLPATRAFPLAAQ